MKSSFLQRPIAAQAAAICGPGARASRVQGRRSRLEGSERGQVDRPTDRPTDRPRPIASHSDHNCQKHIYTDDVHIHSTVVPPAAAASSRGPETRRINRAGADGAGPSAVGPRNKEAPQPQTPLFFSLFFVFPLFAASSSVGAAAAVTRSRRHSDCITSASGARARPPSPSRA